MQLAAFGHKTLGRIALIVAIGLTGCETTTTGSINAPPPPPKAGKTGPSDESKRLAAFYASREARLLAQGRLREDFAPADAPFTPESLVRDFRRIALYDEYRADSPELVEEQTISTLRRWHKPVELAIHFGDSVSPAERRLDTQSVQSFARRLGAITGLTVNFTTLANANFVVMFLDRDEQRSVPAKLSDDLSIMNAEVVRGIETLPDEIYCIAYGLTTEEPPRNYVGAVVLIRSEHSPRLREACIQEEMTQALGLANDDPNVRPSLFNDDEEFALLTRHDEALLKMLYDPRLRDGMTPETSSPILLQVAKDAMKQSRI